MDEMRELVTVGQFARWLGAGLAAWTAGCVLVGRAWGASRGRGVKRGLARGGVLAALGPLMWGAWRHYEWMVRYDPQTGFVGLHKVWVLAVNLLVFVLAGVLVGWAVRAVWDRTAPADDSPLPSG